MSEAKIRYAWPSPELIPYVFAHWEVNLPNGGNALDLLHPEAATIRVALDGSWSFGRNIGEFSPPISGAYLHGMTGKASWVRGEGGSAFCVALKPKAFPAILRVRAEYWSDKLAPLSDAAGIDAIELSEGLRAVPSFEDRVAHAESWLKALLGRGPPLSTVALVDPLDAALADPDIGTVEQLCANLSLTQARLARLTRSVYGFTPKRLLRRERFLRMLHMMQQRPYSEWRDFIDHQYVDQSHMIRDFKDFLGLSPGQYFAMERPLLEAAFAGLMDLFQAVS